MGSATRGRHHLGIPFDFIQPAQKTCRPIRRNFFFLVWMLHGSTLPLSGRSPFCQLQMVKMSQQTLDENSTEATTSTKPANTQEQRSRTHANPRSAHTQNFSVPDGAGSWSSPSTRQGAGGARKQPLSSASWPKQKPEQFPTSSAKLSKLPSSHAVSHPHTCGPACIRGQSPGLRLRRHQHS